MIAEQESWVHHHPRVAGCQLSWAVAITCMLAGPTFADITSTEYVPAETMDLTIVGTHDWCVYRVADTNRPTLVAADFKKSGRGIHRKIKTVGTLQQVEATMFTGVGWGWNDGTTRMSHQHRQGDDDGMGLRVWLPQDVALAFEFEAAAIGEPRQAHLILRCDGRVKILARQGNAVETVVAPTAGKRLGVAVVTYDGNQPLSIEIVGDDQKPQIVRGFATALSAPEHFADGIPCLATRHELAERQAAELGDIDFLKIATDFANCMLRYGRDRYGEVHSPLFAVLLTRSPEPEIGPQPYFDRPSPYDTSSMKTPFRMHNYNRCLNYPAGLGGEGPHKITIYGCDVYEDRHLYEMLIDLSRITSQPKYREAAEEALTWWFTNTMGPADLYPWGEHLGWDFQCECPTYFEGPSKHLYAACYHEIKDDIPFLNLLANLPATQQGEQTPLENYALGVWNAHYWDKQQCVYCRHGDYTGQDGRAGSLAGFPAHQGAHLRLWVKTLLVTENDEMKQQMEEILSKVLDAQIARAQKYGFIPFTFEADVNGGKAEKSGQSDRLARHAAELSVVTTQAAPAISARLRELATLLLGDKVLTMAIRDIQRDHSTSERGELQNMSDGSTKLPAGVAEMSKADTPAEHGQEINRRLRWYRDSQDVAYLKAAEQQARIAYVMFFDDFCPLPKAYASGPRKTTAGDEFPDFYFRGAGLMHAFALVGEMQRQR